MLSCGSCPPAGGGGVALLAVLRSLLASRVCVGALLGVMVMVGAIGAFGMGTFRIGSAIVVVVAAAAAADVAHCSPCL